MGNKFQAKMKKVIPTEKLLLSTELRDGGFVAKCEVDGQDLVTKPYPDNSYLAMNYLIGVIVDMKKEKGQTREVDYIFVTKVKL